MNKFAFLPLILSLSMLPALAADQPPATQSLGSLRLDLNVQESPQIMSEWNAWGSRLNELIDNRFASRAQAKFKTSAGLKAEVVFSVTKDGRISGAELSQKGDSIVFNMLVLDSIKSLAGDSRLAFPQGSNKLVMSAHKVFDLKPGADFSHKGSSTDQKAGRRVSAEPSSTRCCSGKAIFSSEKDIHEFLNGDSKTLCGYDRAGIIQP
jgi:hypothetical protein